MMPLVWMLAGYGTTSLMLDLLALAGVIKSRR